jgi:hypothetical protein
VKTHRHGHGKRENRGRDWSDTATSQGTPKIARRYHKLGGGKEGFSSGTFREGSPASALILDINFQHLARLNFCCFKTPSS